MKAFAFLLIASSLHQAELSTLRYAPAIHKLDAPKCEAPNEGGLQTVINELISLIPTEEALSILLTALTTDEEVQNTMAYISSSETVDRFQKLFKSEEVSWVVRFACQELYLDVVSFLNTVGWIVGLPPLEYPMHDSLRNYSAHRSKGVRGLINAVLNVVPIEKVKKLVKEKVENDEYVKLALNAYHSPKGQEIMKNLRNHSDVKKIIEDLVGLGIDLSGIIGDLHSIFA